MNDLSNAYGRFSDDYREYVISNPRAPRPWFNYMWNDDYAGLVSHTGGGFSFLTCPRDNRVTRMRYNALPWDRPGRYVLLKDVESGEWWSLSWQPTGDLDYDHYECRHGQGYTKITTERRGVRATLTYFVPLDVNAEVWRVSLENLTDKPRSFELYAFTELVMGNALNDLINQANDKHFSDIRYDRSRDTLVATRRYWVLNKKTSVAQSNLAWENVAYFTLTDKPTGFDGSLDAFIGRWRSEANPIAVERGGMGDTEIDAGEPVVALQTKFEIAANGTKDLAAILGVASKDSSDPYGDLTWSALREIETLDAKLAALKTDWDDRLGRVRCETPDPAFDAMINVWNQYQAAVTFDMARNAGYYHGGLLFGTGMRDQFQDILGVVMSRPERVRARILNALRYQFADGSTLHNFFKMIDHGERTHHSDTPLWIPFGVVEYLNETGDFSVLDERVPFHDEGESSVYDRVVRALDFAYSATTERGLPKIMTGDWNDTLDYVGPKGKGETVWGAFFLAYVTRKSFPLFEKRGDIESLARMRDAYDRLAATIEKLCWDGDWYVRAFKDDGESIGSKNREQGQLFLNAQSFAVLSGVAPPDRAKRALESCVERLTTPYGMKICDPAFRKVEDDVGLISRCVPGKKENGAVFNHASAWFALAALEAGDVETGWSVYKKMLPPNSSSDVDRYETEPYVYSEYVTSPEHPTSNQASHSWLTGSAVWMLRTGVDRILGFKTSFDGVTIDPHIPRDWRGFTATRVFRGVTLTLRVENPNGVERGVARMTIDGEPAESNVIAIDAYEKNALYIEATLG